MVEKQLGKICAIIVSYNIGMRFRETFLSALPQVDKVFIVDNGSDQETTSLLKSLQNINPEKTRVIFNEKNLGLAKGQNIGLEYALGESFDWVLLLDHDSEAAPDMIDQMSRAFNNHPERDSIGLIAPYLKELNVEREPHYVVPRYKILFKRRRFGENPVMDDVLCVIASGSLIRLDVIRKLGKFREDFFIDYVDSEFCMSLITHGWKILVVRDAVLAHTLGEKQLHNLGGLKIITTNHSPERRYTIYRNRVYLWKKYLLGVPAYIVFDMAAAGFDLFRILVFEKNRPRKLAQAARGGLTGLFRTDWCIERS
jgi:rhamnosyltransferase